jgi:hypothetical protein
MLFAKFDRTDTSRRRVGESSFEFLDRSARQEIARVREYLEHAVERYPEGGRPEIFSRICSGDDVAFRSASFEVLLHWGFLRCGHKLLPHPDTGTGLEKRPDFLVKSPKGEEFFLEAVLAGEGDGRNPSAEVIKRTVLGRLDESPHASFLLDIHSDGDPRSQPSSNRLISHVHQWLDSLDADLLYRNLETVGPDMMPMLEWSHERWSLILRAIPLRLDQRGNAKGLICGFADGPRLINGWEPLRSAIKEKSRRYGRLEKPLVIAINVDSFQLDSIDEVQALYGEESWVDVLGRSDFSGPQRQTNGAWRGPKGPQNRTASAVWFFNGLTPYTLATRRSTLYLNPWAYMPVPACMLSFPHKKIIHDKLVFIEGKSLSEFFGVSRTWPE